MRREFAADRASRPLLKLTNMTVGYDVEPILRRISIEVQQGEFLGIVGASGSGKTTLLRAVMGQVRRYGGTLELSVENGMEVSVGYVPQVELLDWNFPITVEEVVLLGRWRHGRWHPWASREDRAVAGRVMQQVGIGDLARRQIRVLSGGQQQRVFIARALAGNPSMLLLDEPTSGVDIRSRHEILHLLQGLNAAGTTILLTTHDLNAVANHIPRLLFMKRGEIIADGPPDELLTEDTLSRTYGAPMQVVKVGSFTYVVEDFAEADRGAGLDETPRALRA